jgi:hypothetical protein
MGANFIEVLEEADDVGLHWSEEGVGVIHEAKTVCLGAEYIVSEIALGETGCPEGYVLYSDPKFPIYICN